MSLPLLTEYSRAIQKAAFFKTEKGLVPVMFNDEPHLFAGAFGCVFKMRHSDGSHRALKCFTKYVPDKQQRLEAIAAHLIHNKSSYILHYRYLPEELWVNSAENKYYAVLLMEWVEGKTLGEAVREAAVSGNKTALQQLADNFIDMAVWLLKQDFAHGDLKHDNILVRPDGSLVLIDYDGMYVPALKGKNAENKGVEEYQHPMRTLQHFDGHIDDYAIAVIAAALLCLAQRPELYHQFGDADRMLFKRADLLTSTSPLKTALFALQHPIINALLQKLQESIISKTLHLPGLADVIRLAASLLLPATISETQQLLSRKKQDVIRLENHLIDLQTKPPSAINLQALMKFIKGGTFEMGNLFEDDGYENEEPVHLVTLSDFYMSAYCVFFDEYDAFCEATGSEKPDDEGWGRGNLPVINVSWNDAVAYCNWLSVKNGLKAVYTINADLVIPNWSANGYRLPTEAEWEYAAREGGRKVWFGNGQNILRPTEANFDASANLKESYSEGGEFREKTVPVNSFNPNALGLYNLSGNVWEWCWDWFKWDYYRQSPSDNPRGPETGLSRAFRGGSWEDCPTNSRVTVRYGSVPDSASYFCGFRVCRID